MFFKCIIILVLWLFFSRTFDYIKRELPQIPHSLPILILANHRDMGHHRVVTEDTVRYFIDELDRFVKYRIMTNVTVLH